MPKPKTLKVILSGGGTGGHIFPAIAIANTIKQLAPDAEILFIGAKGRMEMEKVPSAGYPIKGLWISGLQRSFSIKNLTFPLKVVSSLFNTWQIIRSFKPDIVIGTGGYASGPTLRMAAIMNIPTLIQEQNAFPGITNKILSKKVDLICVAYSGMEKYFPVSKIRITGNPVRSEIINNTISKAQALKAFGLTDDKKTILVVGGSLGARTINHSIAVGIENLLAHNLQIIWQTGKLYSQTAEQIVEPYKGKGIFQSAFIMNMNEAYAAADIVVSRSGAIAISELCVTAKPVILVPSPNVAEDHQTKNAITLVESNAALMVKDSKAATELIQAIIDLSNDTETSGLLAESIKKLAYPDATQTIAKHALSLIKAI